MVSDAFVVGEDWISEHYFNTESTKQSFQARLGSLRKSWDERAKDGEQTPASQLTAVRRDLLSALANETTDAASFDASVLTPLITALGYGAARWHRQVSGPVTTVASADVPGSPLGALVRANRVDDLSDLLAKDRATLIEPFAPDGADEVVSVARCLSYLFSGDVAPAFAVVVSGTWALLTERDRWAEGRYLAVDMQLVLDRNDTKRAGEFDRAVAMLSSETVLPDVDGKTWWAETLEDSVKHTVGVSKDLRDGVRESIEIIANEVVRRRKAQGFDPLPDAEANMLARQSLRYLYRILFLLYAEASPEMRVLPVGAPEYALGYGLDRLRELVLVELGEESRHRTHLYASLGTLFRLIDAGHDAARAADSDVALREGLTFNPLNADLFTQTATSHIDEVGLGDGALQRVLQLLLLTRENQVKRGRDRGFISYADLGVNQLGAVYEGLMSYTGFFAKEDLYEVAPGGDGSKGSWVVPVTRADGIAQKDFVRTTDPITGESRPRRYSGGEFVFRLSGRERQTSASFYSPEVLTKFVVSQALEELLDQDGRRTTAAEILQLSVCEPALGSGAFAIEAVRQLAEQYLERREHEMGERIDPDERPRELQKAKAAIALHQVYGVDLNATAVELAEISLWLDTMVDGLKAPWFGLRLRRGNSLIGARRAVYSQKQVTDKAWLRDVPQDVPVATLVDDMRAGHIASATAGKIHHFLLPADGWGSATEAKEGKELAPEAHAALREWRKKIKAKPTSTQLKKLTALAHRVEVLWQFTLRRLELAEAQVSREIELWRDPRERDARSDVVSRVDIEAFLHDPNGAYQRLRRVMDAWCALWFWPLTDTLTCDVAPPTLEEWIDGLTAVLGVHAEVKAPKRASVGAQTLGLPTDWHDLDAAEEVELGFAQVEKIDDALAAYPWLAVSEGIARANGFFHWELDFAGVFARGGFDLQLGNPPWVRPDFDEYGALSEADAWWALNPKPSAEESESRRTMLLGDVDIRISFVNDASNVASTRLAVSDRALFPALTGLRPDLYRTFMIRTWSNARHDGIVALVHPDSHLTDQRAGALRAEGYRRLRRLWHFINELKLFEDVDHHKSFTVSVYGKPGRTAFWMATSLYHPDTAVRSLTHDGSGSEPGIKDDDGKWDTRPHRSRVFLVDELSLAGWHELLEAADTDPCTTRAVYSVNSGSSNVIRAIAASPRVAEIGAAYSQGWNEKTDYDSGVFRREWGDSGPWEDAILQGPFVFVSTPFYQTRNPSMSGNWDWTAIDLEELRPEATPITSYKRTLSLEEYRAKYDRLGPAGGSALDYYRVTWRCMAGNNRAERTLIPAIIPPGAAHVDGLFSLAVPQGDLRKLGLVSAFFSSFVADYAVRVAPKSTIRAATANRLPFRSGSPLDNALLLRTARLNCVTAAYGSFWMSIYSSDWLTDDWAGGLEYEGRAALNHVDAEWSASAPLRRAIDRRQAQVEIDAIVALLCNISAEDLTSLYRTQFPVLVKYDRNVYLYDVNGRVVPSEVLKAWRQKGDAITLEDRQAVHPGSGVTYTYELPFVTLDREADLRQAYAHFERVLKERS